MCTFSQVDEGECISVQSFDEFKNAIKNGEDEIVFCGGFNIRKDEIAAVQINKDVDVRCLEKCTIFGVGPFLQIGGAMSKTRFQNMKFIQSVGASNSAVVVSTMTSLSETTFCSSEFESNNIGPSENGGAIYVDQTSGTVNIYRTTFTDNSAYRGGAIYSMGWSLNVLESRFVANKSYNVGNAIFVAEESKITISSSTFLLNTVEPTSVARGNVPVQNFVIAVEPSKSIRASARTETYLDAGQNRVIMSGDCGGYYNLWEQDCQEFILSR